MPGLVAALRWSWLLIAIAPITARNCIGSGQWCRSAASGGASLLEFHRPPPGLIDPAALQRDPLYEALHLERIDADRASRLSAPIRSATSGRCCRSARTASDCRVATIRASTGRCWSRRCSTWRVSPRPTRRLHVWPIHAFVATHLLVLMLFEADTYGYRLVMPMYAPMIVVAAQVPLRARRCGVAVARVALAERATRWRSRGRGTGRCCRAGLAVARALVDDWPDSVRPPCTGSAGRRRARRQSADRVGRGGDLRGLDRRARRADSARAACPDCATRGSSGSIRRARCRCPARVDDGGVHAVRAQPPDDQR